MTSLPLDHRALLWIQSKRTRGLTRALTLLTLTGTGRAWAIAVATLAVLNQLQITPVPDQLLFLRSMLGALLAWILGSAIKRAVARPRPSEQVPNLLPAIQTPPCRSFPSSHASSTFAFATTLGLVQHPWCVPVLIWAALVTFSRFYLGVHFLTDLAGGIILGVLCGIGNFLLIGAIFG